MTASGAPASVKTRPPAAGSGPGPESQRVDAQVIVTRLMAAADKGQALGDPRVPGTIATWAGICTGVSDDTIRQLIPGIIRLLFRKHEMKPRLEKAGLREAVTLQHEAIAPFVIAFRRMQVLKATGGDAPPGQLLAETRKELRDLNQRFYAALDQAIALQDDNRKLRAAVVQARGERDQARSSAADAEARLAAVQAQADKFKKDASTFYNELEDSRAKALTKLKYALQNLHDALELKLNDPDSTLVTSASLSVQSYYMVCEDLGRGTDAMKLARSILGNKASAIGL